MASLLPGGERSLSDKWASKLWFWKYNRASNQGLIMEDEHTSDGPALMNAIGMSRGRDTTFFSNQHLADNKRACLASIKMLSVSMILWWGELGAVLLSIACLCAISAILVVLNNEPLTTWTARISPNAAISVLTTVGRTFLMLPVASCIGQSKWSHFKKPRNLKDLQLIDDASRGPAGAVTLLIRVRSWAAALGAILVIVSLSYEPSAQQILSYPVRNVNDTSSTARIMQAYRWGPTFGSTNASTALAAEYGEITTPTFACPTTYCVYPDFDALAICGGLQNASQALHQTCKYSSNSTDSSFDYSCFYSIGDDPGQVEILFETAEPGVIVIGGSRGMGWTLPNSAIPLSLLFVNATLLEQPQYPSIVQAAYHAVQWNWWYCSQAYTNVSVRNGSLQYNVSSEPLTGSPANAATELLYLIEGNSNSQTYAVAKVDTNDFWHNLGPQLAAPIMDNPFGTYIEGLDQGVSEIVSTLENITSSLSATILSTGNTNATWIYGSAMTSEVYVHVRWLWFIVPVCITFAAVIYLTQCVLLNAELEGPLHKSSQLALLLGSVEGWQPDDTQLKTETREVPIDLEYHAKNVGRVSAMAEQGVPKFIKSGVVRPRARELNITGPMSP